MSLPKIGISTSILAEKDPDLIQVDRVYVNKEYVTAVGKSGGVPLLLPVTADEVSVAEYTDLCDGFLFSGGIDINPRFFNRQPHPRLGRVNTEVDLFQLALIKKVLASGKPLLCICRGIQLLNVALGGDLYQDMEEVEGDVLQHEQHAPKYDAIHEVRFTEGSFLHTLFGASVYTNSYHHQSVKLTGSGLVATGYTADGVVEAVEAEKHKFCVGVQWHPEMMLANSDEMGVLFKALIRAAGQ